GRTSEEEGYTGVGIFAEVSNSGPPPLAAKKKTMKRVKTPPLANPSRHCRLRKAKKAPAMVAPISRNAIANRISFSNGRNFLDRNLRHGQSFKRNAQRPTLNAQSS